MSATCTGNPIKTLVCSNYRFWIKHSCAISVLSITVFLDEPV